MSNAKSETAAVLIDWPDLKPCPFCGTTPATPACFKADDAAQKWGYVECTGCGGRSGDIRTGYEPVCEWAWSAAEEWNHRA